MFQSQSTISNSKAPLLLSETSRVHLFAYSTFQECRLVLFSVQLRNQLSNLQESSKTRCSPQERRSDCMNEARLESLEAFCKHHLRKWTALICSAHWTTSRRQSRRKWKRGLSMKAPRLFKVLLASTRRSIQVALEMKAPVSNLIKKGQKRQHNTTSWRSNSSLT